MAAKPLTDKQKKRLEDRYTLPGMLREILKLERQIAVVQLLLETATEVEDWLEDEEFDHIVPPMTRARESLMEAIEKMKVRKLSIVIDFEEDLDRELDKTGQLPNILEDENDQNAESHDDVVSSKAVTE
eukprot:s2143_g5.t1